MTPAPAALTRQLDAAGALPATWATPVNTVRRERFIPDRAWVDQADGDDIDCVPIDRRTNPQRWLAAVRSDRVIVTQYDDGATQWPQIGYRPTCSSSMPSTMMAMLDALDLDDGMDVLEIGTGTGYNAALLAQRAGRVVTVEVDEAIARHARIALCDLSNVRVVTGDGMVGHRLSAPFDRVISTAAVRLGQLPYEWVTQARPGGVIIAPVRTDMAAGPLVRFDVHDDGTAVGRTMPMRVEFMELRAHRSPSRWTRKRWDDPVADRTSTDVEPWTALLAEAPQWAIAVAVPQCRVDVWDNTDVRGPGHGVAWLVDPVSGSWASVVPSGSAGLYDVRQYGPRRLWDEAEAAFRWWRAAGEPAVEAWEFVVEADCQRVRLSGVHVSVG